MWKKESVNTNTDIHQRKATGLGFMHLQMTYDYFFVRQREPAGAHRM